MKTVAFVPIKMNNERLPNKNILPLGGKPLCAHVLETLLTVKRIDEVIVFCSAPEIEQYIPKGVKLLLREPALDTFTARHYDIVQSFFDKVTADVYINAHVTNPFISSKTFSTVVDKVVSGEYDSALVVEEIREHLWREGLPFNFTKEDPPRTQDLAPLYSEVGVFAYRRHVFLESGTRYGKTPYFVPVDKTEAVDINYRADYDFARALLEVKFSQTGDATS